MRAKAGISRLAFFGGSVTVFGIGKIVDAREEAEASTRQLPFREVGHTIFLALALCERVLEVPSSHEQQSCSKTVQETAEGLQHSSTVSGRGLLWSKLR
jgi:hypothetical protein